MLRSQPMSEAGFLYYLTHVPSLHGGRHFQNKPAVFDDAICFFFLEKVYKNESWEYDRYKFKLQIKMGKKFVKWQWVKVETFHLTIFFMSSSSNGKKLSEKFCQMEAGKKFFRDSSRTFSKNSKRRHLEKNWNFMPSVAILKRYHSGTDNDSKF